MPKAACRSLGIGGNGTPSCGPYAGGSCLAAGQRHALLQSSARAKYAAPDCCECLVLVTIRYSGPRPEYCREVSEPAATERPLAVRIQVAAVRNMPCFSPPRALNTRRRIVTNVLEEGTRVRVLRLVTSGESSRVSAVLGHEVIKTAGFWSWRRCGESCESVEYYQHRKVFGGESIPGSVLIRVCGPSVKHYRHLQVSEERSSLASIIPEAMEDDCFATNLIFSGEATFHLSGNIHPHNMRAWCSEPSRSIVQLEQDAPKNILTAHIQKWPTLFCLLSWRDTRGKPVGRLLYDSVAFDLLGMPLLEIAMENRSTMEKEENPKRKVRVCEINQKRDVYGEFHHLFPDLRNGGCSPYNSRKCPRGDEVEEFNVLLRFSLSADRSVRRGEGKPDDATSSTGNNWHHAEAMRYGDHSQSLMQPIREWVGLHQMNRHAISPLCTYLLCGRLEMSNLVLHFVVRLSCVQYLVKYLRHYLTALSMCWRVDFHSEWKVSSRSAELSNKSQEFILFLLFHSHEWVPQTTSITQPAGKTREWVVLVDVAETVAVTAEAVRVSSPPQRHVRTHVILLMCEQSAWLAASGAAIKWRTSKTPSASQLFCPDWTLQHEEKCLTFTHVFRYPSYPQVAHSPEISLFCPQSPSSQLLIRPLSPSEGHHNYFNNAAERKISSFFPESSIIAVIYPLMNALCSRGELLALGARRLVGPLWREAFTPFHRALTTPLRQRVTRNIFRLRLRPSVKRALTGGVADSVACSYFFLCPRNVVSSNAGSTTTRQSNKTAPAPTRNFSPAYQERGHPDKIAASTAQQTRQASQRGIFGSTQKPVRYGAHSQSLMQPIREWVLWPLSSWLSRLPGWSRILEVSRIELSPCLVVDSFVVSRARLFDRPWSISQSVTVTETSTLTSSTLAGGWARAMDIYHDRPMRFPLHHHSMTARVCSLVVHSAEDRSYACQVERLYRDRYPEKTQPSRRMFSCLVVELHEIGSLNPQQRNRRRTRTDEAAGVAVLAAVAVNSHVSTR
ncbi:hypothetical protein PR048_009579 [Dryococelus australis]|uniref:CST complex subunit CTC1 n=1 Tax=Dryococelus australis TaxID=614101 RepID=A0ABQ9I097_9NEOP|nr:hypothetical protein PR048_009579 [Dryococelus australis]